MAPLLASIIQLLPFIILLALGIFIGGRREKKHLRNITERLARFQSFQITNLKTFPDAKLSELPPKMYVAETVIACDYFKLIASGFRNLFGGEVKSFETLQQRAKQEAMLRIIEQAHAAGYNAICNLRFETADIGGSASSSNKKKQVPMAAVIASATAYNRDDL